MSEAKDAMIETVRKEAENGYDWIEDYFTILNEAYVAELHARLTGASPQKEHRP